MNKAVFLDRDGVINDGTQYYTYSVDSFIFNPGIFEGLRLLQQHGFMLIVITNQSGVAKGVYSIADVERVHTYMVSELERHDITITQVYYCPHHPDVSACECRKPGTLLFEQAIKTYNIDVHNSYMIGDSKRDIEAAHKVGVKGILISKNESIVPYCKAIIGNE
jgi:D-glycero-D-manno-heptose 1,7-bisphosphate phosphatase